MKKKKLTDLLRSTARGPRASVNQPRASVNPVTGGTRAPSPLRSFQPVERGPATPTRFPGKVPSNLTPQQKAENAQWLAKRARRRASR